MIGTLITWVALSDDRDFFDTHGSSLKPLSYRPRDDLDQVLILVLDLSRDEDIECLHLVLSDEPEVGLVDVDLSSREPILDNLGNFIDHVLVAFGHPNRETNMNGLHVSSRYRG